MTPVSIGIDIGGTFTDLLAFDEDAGTLTKIKVPTTPVAPEQGVVAALKSFRASAPSARIVRLAHSTTIATNALLGQVHLELPRVVLLTTAGFRDVLEIGRQNRSEVYNLFVERPRALIAAADRLGIEERLDFNGKVLVPLREESIDRAIDHLREHDISAVAVALLHAYANGAHERRIKKHLLAQLPELDVTLSSETDAEYREFERTSTTVVNAVLRPLVAAYLQRLDGEVRALGIDAPLYVMQSNGGMIAITAAARRPATLIESGPAAGVIGAAHLGKRLGITSLLSFDMGGTTAKAGTIFNGEPHIVGEFEAAGRTHSGRSVKGSGYPVRFPFIDLAEVSAGGGTIAWIDSGGTLKVGPLSAGADPGPAAYGRGNRATVTDANIVLGRLNDVALLGGTMPIDAGRSRRAVAALQEALPELDLDGVAAGIIALVNNEMAKVLRIVSIERGYDPRAFAIMAFGGGGPLHICTLADELEIGRVVIPVDPGLFSAFGLLAADIRVTSVRTILSTASDLSPRRAEDLFHDLEAEARVELGSQNVAPDAMAFRREFELRYAGQSFELTVPAGTIAAAVEAFHELHERRYGYASRGEDVEFVTARLAAIGRIAKPEPRPRGTRNRGLESPPVRSVHFDNIGRCETPVYQRDALEPGHRICGPAVIEQYDSSTLLPPHWRADVDRFGNLELTR